MIGVTCTVIQTVVRKILDTNLISYSRHLALLLSPAGYCVFCYYSIDGDKGRENSTNILSLDVSLCTLRVFLTQRVFVVVPKGLHHRYQDAAGWRQHPVLGRQLVHAAGVPDAECLS